MAKLIKAINAWGSPAFNNVLKREIESMDSRLLPLQQGLSLGNYIGDDDFSVMVLTVLDGPQFISVKTGICYTSVIAGCSCADDPTPVNVQAEYCELQFEINKETAEMEVSLVDGANQQSSI